MPRPASLARSSGRVGGGRGAGGSWDPGHAPRRRSLLRVVTGSTAHDDEVDLSKVAGADTTVVLMAAGRLAETCADLIAAGRPPDEPAAIVQWAWTPEQRSVVGTLADLPMLAGTASIGPPPRSSSATSPRSPSTSTSSARTLRVRMWEDLGQPAVLICEVPDVDQRWLDPAS